jgi:hypothetical protein
MPARKLHSYAAILALAVQRGCISIAVLKALNLSIAQEQAAVFGVLFFSRLLTAASESMITDIFSQLTRTSGSNELVHAVEIFIQRHLRAAASEDSNLMEKVLLLLRVCEEVAVME